MNSLIPSSNSLILPLSQLSPHCTRLLNSIYDERISQKEKILYEQTLWSEVKKIRSLNDPSIFLYLIGYYHAILYQVVKSFDHNDLFQYNILIRLGDLSRYMERLDVAEYYYCNARNLFPLFGHAYNQLGLLTKPTNCYKCCYYYARAAKSSEKPLNSIADSNLRIAVSKYDCEILSRILDNDGSDVDLSEQEFKSMKVPDSSFDWFYVIIVAIYADNIAPVTKPFLSFFNENFSTEKYTIARDGVKSTTLYCDRDSYILLASLDIMLDWMKLGSQSKKICPLIAQELRQIRKCLVNVITSCQSKDSQLQGSNQDKAHDKSGSSSTGNEVSSTQFKHGSTNLSDSTQQESPSSSGSQSYCKSPSSSRMLALPHDYVLRGFGPLDRIHEDLTFRVEIRDKCMMDKLSLEDSSSIQNYVDPDQLYLISTRLRAKIDASGISVRKKTRNIALESILYNIAKDEN